VSVHSIAGRQKAARFISRSLSAVMEPKLNKKNPMNIYGSFYKSSRCYQRP
jgi:hypothetical protein